MLSKTGRYFCTMTLLDGKQASEAIRNLLAAEVAVHTAQGKRPPHLAAILVGTNGASETYVASKVKNCAAAGFDSTLIRLPELVSEAELLAEIEALNNNEKIDGILVQLPLPKHINEGKVIYAIDPEKDVDGFHPINAGKLMLGQPAFVPATPYGIVLLMRHYGLSAKGKNVVIIGRSNIVGRPLSILLSTNSPEGNGTVTLCHSHTQEMEKICAGADILVAALGSPGFVHAGMVKEGAVVIDVGITRVPDESRKTGFRIAGDVQFQEVASKASFLTPVPGGVGLMTIAALLTNTMEAWKRKQA